MTWKQVHVDLNERKILLFLFVPLNTPKLEITSIQFPHEV